MKNNILIAEFMGVEFINGVYGGVKHSMHSPFTTDKLKYHTDWNCLMPVIEKIQEMKEVNACWITESGMRISFSGNVRPEINTFYSYNSHTTESKIGTIYYAVVQFITWYNLNQSTK